MMLYASVSIGSVVRKEEVSMLTFLAIDMHTASLHYGRRATLWIRSAPHVCHVHRANFLIHLVLQFLGAWAVQVWHGLAGLERRKHMKNFWRLQRVYQQRWDLFIGKNPILYIIHNPIWMCFLLFGIESRVMEIIRICCDSEKTGSLESLCMFNLVLCSCTLRSVKTVAMASLESRRHGNRTCLGLGMT